MTTSSLPVSESTLAPDHPIPASGFVDDVREILFQWQARGIPTALVTLINFEGSSPRPVGSQLVVNARGEYSGLISGGCLEAALIAEATDCIARNQQRIVRYGKDSDYFDIQLPCGSGIDVLITPNPDEGWVQQLYQAYIDRTPVEWSVALASGDYTVRSIETGTEATPQENGQLTRAGVESALPRFSKRYLPRTRIVVVGSGAIFDVFTDMARHLDVELLALSTAPGTTLQSVHSPGDRITRIPLQTPARFDGAWLDRWTALVTLTHDHHWEAGILEKALATSAFFITSLGSRETHRRRLDALRSAGLPEAELSRIKGPAGLDIGGQSPPEIALSILAEIVSRRNGKLRDASATA